MTAGGSPGAFPELVAAAVANGLLQVAAPRTVPGTLLEAKPPAYALICPLHLQAPSWLERTSFFFF